MTRPRDANAPREGPRWIVRTTPEITAALDEIAPEMAMDSPHQRLTGASVGVGSVGFDEPGAFDLGGGRAVKPQPDKAAVPPSHPSTKPD